MRIRVFGLCSLCLFVASHRGVAFGADEKVAALKEAPAGVSPEVKAAISETGYRVIGKAGVICDVWLAKDIPLKPKFKTSLRIKYPFQEGELIGVIRYPDGSKPNDFRGQAIKPGTYTLRYGLQPDDGNHLGTSDIRDFLVGCPPKSDKDPKRIADVKELFKLSATSAGGTHPAIFLLIPPPDKAYDAAGVTHEDERNLLIFQGNAMGKEGDTAVAVPVSVVTVGKTDA